MGKFACDFRMTFNFLAATLSRESFVNSERNDQFQPGKFQTHLNTSWVAGGVSGVWVGGLFLD